MLHMMMLREAVASTALSCGCGTCVACRAANGDADAWADVLTAASDIADAERARKGLLFTCPHCGMTSHHPEDARHGYCGNCHDFTRD